MATLKKATGKKARTPSTPKEVETEGGQEKKKAAPRQVRTFSEKRLRALLITMLAQFSAQVAEGGATYTNGDGFKLMQMMESLGLDKPSDVKVEWVEPKGP